MKKIDKKNIEDIFALTPMQEGMLFHYLHSPGSEVYFEQLSLEISGKIDLQLFKQALDFVIGNNEMLRTLFRWEKIDTPLQIILKKYNLQPDFYDFTRTDPGEVKKRLLEVKNNDRNSRFQLDEVPFRVILCKVNEENYVMILSNHHILFDGWSTGIIFNEFFSAYHDLFNGKKLVRPIKTRFSTFIQWLQDHDSKGQEKFWGNYLKNFDTQTGLPVKTRVIEPEITATETNKYQLRLEKDLKDKLDDFARKYRITLAAVLYSAWGILLQKYNNIDDVVFGTTVSGRSAKIPGIENMVGLFINTIPLRVRSRPGEKTEDFLLRIDKTLKLRETYEASSLVKIKEYSDFASNEELFDSIVVIENYPLDIRRARGNGNLFIESHSLVEQTHYDLTTSITLSDDIEVVFKYNNRLFEQWTIERLSGHFLCILQSMIEEPGLVATHIELIGDEEKRQILFHFNQTGFDYPVDRSIDELFSEQVSKIPDQVALAGMTVMSGSVCKPRVNTGAAPLKNEVFMTFRELNERAIQLAVVLGEKDAVPGTIVGIMLERSIEMVVGILAVLKAGGAYLPIDPGYPLERINYMLCDSGAKILLTTKNIAKTVNFDKEIIDPDSLPPRTSFNLPEGICSDFPVSLSSSPAYVIYTSGSTGKPKGVMVEHGNVNYLVNGLRERIYKNYGGCVKVCLVSPFVFDASVKQIFGALLLGNCLCIVPEETRINGAALFEFYKKHHVDISDGTPAHLQLLMENEYREGPGVRNYLVGGEALSWKTACDFLDRFCEDDPMITNLYGPTECTVDAVCFRLNRGNAGVLHTIPIGHPLPGCRIYVLAGENKLQAVGVPGELCIMGKGVSRGYLNQPELTAEKFEDLWDTQEYHNEKLLWGVRGGRTTRFLEKSPPGRRRQKIYKTGDLARWLPDGNIEFLGRLDHQVKIRGYRIELGEIENHLLAHQETKEAVVIVREELSGEKNLCAYIVTSAGGVNVSSSAAFREYLSEKLPGYMVPLYFVFPEKLPLTAAGKVDRRALPAPVSSWTTPYVAPRDKLEKKLAEIWSSLLNVAQERIGIEDHFFLLGGHSLKVISLTARIHKEFNVKVGVGDIFRAPILRDIADYIRGLEIEAYRRIQPVEEKEYYPASPAQQRMYFLQQLAPDSAVYNMPVFLELEGELRKEKLESVIRQLVERHEGFRTSFHQDGDLFLLFPRGITVQVIHSVGDTRFSMEYYNGETGGQRALKGFIRPFDLSRPPLLRAALVNMDSTRHILMLDMHHIISDGISTEILAREFMVLYRGQDLTALNVRYRDFSCWQKRYFASPDFLAQEVFWLQQFRGDVPVLELPLDFLRPSLQAFEGAVAVFEVESMEIAVLKEVASRNGATLFMVWTAIYTIFLAKLTGSKDIVVGTPVTGRRHVDLEGVIGFFVNSLALRNYPVGEKTFTAFLQQVKQGALQAFENQEYPFEELVEKVAVNRDMGRNPLFDTMLSFQNTVTAKMHIPGLTLKSHEVETGISKFDLSLIGEEVGDRFIFRFNYCTKLFKKETAGRFIKYFKGLVSSVAGNCHQRIAGLEILSPGEKKTLLEDFNNTAVVYPRDKTLHQLFEGQVDKSPDAIAAAGKCLVSGYQSLSVTYRELSEKSTGLAHRLMEMHVQSDTIVGIMMERSIDMIIGILGILKAGGAYLPIDPDYPEERKQYMLDDTGVKVLLTGNRTYSSIFSSRPGALLDLSAGLHFDFERSSTSLPPFYPCSCSSLAYVIYTSGTTGNPRGVMVVHENAVNVVTWFAREYDVKIGSNVLLMSNYTFDASVNQIFATLLHGGRLHMVSNALIQDIGALRRYIEKNHIHILNFVPLFLNELLGHQDRLQSIRTVISGGEALTDSIKKRIMEKGYRLYNHYGPTEATIDALSLRCEISCRVTLGKPIANTRCVVLDRWGGAVPVGIPGELAVSGAGVARGYLNQPGLTNEKFGCLLWNLPGRQRQNFYKTGDLVRWLSDGNIEFLGRIDRQVKISGFRIELGEIENRLLCHANIREVVVLCKEERINDKYLCAYIVPHSAGILNKTVPAFVELREYLSRSLPEYMVPRYFLELDIIPLTPNGKIDRSVLSGFPIPDQGLSNVYVAPRGEVEEKLACLWSEVLSIEKEKISIDANFFHLGGHSLKATVLASRIHRAFNINVPLGVIFKTPYIGGLSAYIKEASASKYIPLDLVEKKEYYPLSSAQRRLYILQQMDDKQGIGYNMPSVWQLQGEPDRGKMEVIFHKLIRRHESLRTFFTLVNEEPVQRVHEESVIGNWSLVIGEAEKSEIEDIITNFIKPFDLSRAPLLRVGLIKLANTPANPDGHPSADTPTSPQRKKPGSQYLLMLDMHHIITDGISMKVFVREFTELYRDKELTPLKFQYKDYSQWQNKEKESDLMHNQAEYWLEQFQEEIPVLELPTDFARTGEQKFTGSRLSFQISHEETKRLKKLALEKETTLYVILLSAFNVFLSKITNQESIVVGTVVAARQHPDLEQIIGMFVNTLVFIHHPVSQKHFNEFLKEVKQKTLEAFENQDYPFEELVEKIAVNRDTRRNPLFDVMFTLQDMDIDTVRIPGLRLEPYDHASNTSKFDLMFQFIEKKENLNVIIEYCTTLFKETTIQRFISYFKKITAVIIENPGVKSGEIEIISEREKNQILFQFNNTASVYPKHKHIQQLFEEKREISPDKAALVYKFQVLTYNALDQLANQLACHFQDNSLEPEGLVGIMLETSPGMIVAVLAALKAGGAYLPVNPDYPPERINLMLMESNAQLLVTSRACRGSGLGVSRANPGKDILYLEDFLVKAGGDSGYYPVSNTDCHLAYVIYTSGSTGIPKGVMVEHRNVVRLIKNTNFIDFREDDRILQTGALEFDASTFEIWGALLNGLTLYLADKNEILTPGILKKIIINNQISIMWLTSPLFNQMVQGDMGIFTGLRTLLVGGDVLSPHHINQVRENFPGLHIINGYGPTENTTFSTTFLIDREYKSSIPIGKSISNSFVYIVDKNNKLQPIGIMGELLVGGDGVARGYLNNPGLTAEKFIRHQKTQKEAKKISPYSNSTGSTLYRTGDLARWLPCGNIEFSGRIDKQIKIRGFRIEPGEIENLLISHPSIKEAVVIDHENDSKDKYLCAYIVSGGQITWTGLREFLSAVLPGYMIPSYFMMLERIPLTSNGKIDRKQLPMPGGEFDETFAPPGNETHEQLVGIWSDLLGIQEEKISIDANFFELGGHSLKLVLLIAAVHKRFNMKLSMAEMSGNLTIRGLALKINAPAGSLSPAIISELKESKTGIIKYLRENNPLYREYLSIEPWEKKEYYVLSSAQKRLFIMQQMDTGLTSYNQPGIFSLAGDIDLDRLYRTFKNQVYRHESLRTSFDMIKGEPIQRIHEEVEFEVQYNKSLINSHGSAVSSPIKVEKTIRDFIRPFDLSQAPLFRVELLKTQNRGYLLMMDMHHIISDGMSMKIFVHDFMTLYGGNQLPRLKLQYKDYAQWQILEKETYLTQAAYWQEQYQGEIPVLELPTDFTRPGDRSFEGASLRVEMNPGDTRRLKELALKQGTTLYTVLLAVFYVFLSKITHQESFIVGTVVAGRRHSDLVPIIGMFVNTLALILHPGNQKHFDEFLQEVKQKTLEAFDNQDYPFEELVEKIAVNRDASRNPLFDVMFTLQDLDIDTIKIPGLRLEPCDHASNSSKFDLLFQAMEKEENLCFTIEYCTKLFKESTVQRYIQYYQILLKKILINTGQKIIHLEILPGEEKRLLLYDFNHTVMDYPRDKTIHQLFAEQVVRIPDAVALMGFNDSKTNSYTSYNYMTYRELNRQSDCIALQMRKKCISPEPIIAILAEGSPEMIAGIMGILKSGAAYLPIDPDYPSERINYMLEDSQAEVLVIAGSSGKEVEKPDSLHLKKEPEIIFIDTLQEYNSPSSPLLNVSSSHSPHHSPGLAYIIYTSGTTGKPKGVMINHRSLVNLCTWHNRYFRVKNTDHATQYAMMGFDASVWEIFPYLISGASVTIINPGIKLDIKKLNRFYETHDITIGFLPTQVCEQFMELENRSLRIMLTGGDYLQTFIKRDYQLYNNYGPTENTVVNTSILINRQYASIPIGKPVYNNQVYILHPGTLRVQPIGIPGELWIGGEGLARGYLNNPELTLEKFVLVKSQSHKDVYFSWCPGVLADKLYKTGDLARWLPEGNIEFLGRIDQQVKIRGFRIELGEIESLLKKHQQIKEAVVITREDKEGQKYLCAYIAGNNEKKLDIPGLREYLTTQLPGYMMPSFFVHLDNIPLTPNGKIDRDRKLLPEPAPEAGKRFTAPGNEVEEKLAETWSDVLGIKKERIGIDASFFELGGHSLKATALISKIHKELNVKIPLAVLFKKSTIRELSYCIKEIKETKDEKYQSIKTVETCDYYPLSSAQKRMFIVYQMEEKEQRITYHIPRFFIIKGNLDEKKFETIFKKLIERHEVLRSSFHWLNEKVIQKINDRVEFKVKYAQLSEKEARKRIKNFLKPFDPDNAPLLRVELIHIEEKKYFVLFDIHHIISDGASIEILIKEFVALYEGKNLAPLSLQYKDYAVWQNKSLKQGKLKNQERYWLNKLEGFAFTQFPLDHFHSYHRVERKNEYRKIDKPIYNEIEKFCHKYNVTKFTFMITIFAIVLANEIEQTDITIGLSTSIRDNSDLKYLIGILINLLLIRIKIDDEDTFLNLLTQSKRTVIDALNNQHYPYEILHRKIREETHLKKGELFSILFIYFSSEINEAISTDDFEICPLQTEEVPPKNDICLYVYEANETITFNLVYNGNIYDEYSIKNLLDDLFSLIRRILENDDKKDDSTKIKTL